MKASSTRDSSANIRTVFSSLVSNRTSTRSQKTGGCHYLILLLPGKSYVWKASSSPATNHLRSSVPDPPLHATTLDRGDPSRCLGVAAAAVNDGGGGGGGARRGSPSPPASSSPRPAEATAASTTALAAGTKTPAS